jgi:hypothetical protein
LGLSLAVRLKSVITLTDPYGTCRLPIHLITLLKALSIYPYLRYLSRTNVSMAPQCSWVHLPEHAFSASPHLPLQLQHPIKERFRSGRTSRHVDINRNNTLRESSIQKRVLKAKSTHDHSHELLSKSSGSILLRWHRSP